MANSRTNQEWLHDLSASDPSQEAAIADLREILLRAALYSFGRSPGAFGGQNPEEIRQRAEDCAQDALIAVMAHLADFRGESKFTTWAYKFAINTALMAARHERWKGVSLDELASSSEDSFFEWAMMDKSPGAHPERSAMQDEVQKTIREVIEDDLTERQRGVLTMMVFHEVPMDEVVRHLGTDRNTVYKMLHDARRKLKSGLERRGFDIGEMLSLFGLPQ